MGFFSKIWKGLKKGVKKIGKGIKSAFKKFGKFMNKIGILGQIAMMFILPGIGQALGSMWTGIAGQTAVQAGASASAAVAAGTATAAQAATAATVAAGGSAAATGLMSMGAVGQAAGKVMQFVGNTVGKVGTVFNNITKGVTDTLGNFAKTASNKLFGTTFEASANFFGAGDSAWNRSFGENSRFQRLTTSDNIFKAESDARKIDFNKSQLSKLDEVVAESSSDWDSFEYGQKEFANNSAVDRAIVGGESNWTASLNDTIPDAGAFEPTVSTDPQFKPNYGPQQASLMEKVTEGIKGIPDRVTGKISEIAADPLGYAGEGMEERFQSGVQTRLMQEAGIVEKPEYNVQNISNVAYVPSFDSFGGTQQQYGAPEIMNARSFEQQVTNNPSPYGYTAFQYGNYMAQFGQTA